LNIAKTKLIKARYDRIWVRAGAFNTKSAILEVIQKPKAKNRLIAGPAKATKNSIFGRVGSAPNSATPPKINSA
jgi:hypothetical protein